MKNKPIEKPATVTAAFCSMVKTGRRYTPQLEVALYVAQKTGKPPIEYITPSLREIYLKAWPKLANAIK
jgi:hypothetical protein